MNKNDEYWYRLNIEDFLPNYWDNADLRYLSKDFFREFRNKFEWFYIDGLTRSAIFIRKKFGDKFFTEITGQKK